MRLGRELRQQTIRRILLILIVTLLGYCTYNLAVSGMALMNFGELKGLSLHEFGYPKRLGWVILIFSFWLFFVIGFAYSIRLKTIGWILANAFLLIGIVVLSLRLYTWSAPNYYIDFIQLLIILFLFLLLSRKRYYANFHPAPHALKGYVYSLLIVLLWGCLFLVIKEH